MNNSKTILLNTLIASMMSITACQPAPPGLDIHGYQFQLIPGHELRIPLAQARVNANHIHDNGYNSYPNLLTSFQAELDNNGWAHVNGVRLPAQWGFRYVVGYAPTPCNGLSWVFDVDTDDVVVLPCQYFGHIRPLSVSPVTADAQSMPSSFTASGEGIDGTYGMPLVEFFDEYGRLRGSLQANSVGTDSQGPMMTGNMPYLPYTCSYGVIVYSVLSDGTYDVVGVTSMEVTNGQELPPLFEPPPPPDPDPCNTDPYNERLECFPVY